MAGHTKLMLAVIAGALLAGCASTNQVLASEPDEVFHTSYAPAEVAACFAHRNHARVIERVDGARVAEFRNGYGGVVKAYSIYPDGQGSRIESRHNFINVPGQKWKRCVGLEPMQPGDMGEQVR